MEIKKRLLSLICFLMMDVVFAQTSTLSVSTSKMVDGKLAALEKGCDSFYNKEKIPQLDSVTTLAIHFTPQSDAKHLAKFYFYKGFAIESSSASDTAGTYQYRQSIFYAEKAGEILCKVKAMGANNGIY